VDSEIVREPDVPIVTSQSPRDSHEFAYRVVQEIIKGVFISTSETELDILIVGAGMIWVFEELPPPPLPQPTSNINKM
jgi:hypothetical protein